jgi:uncharacterized protein YacL
MRLHTFRQIFALLLMLTLCGTGIYSGLHLLEIQHVRLIDQMRTIPNYTVQATVALAAIGLLLGLWVGPRLADLIITAGKALEQMSAADKIAIGAGTALGAIVMVLLNQLLFQIPLLPVRVGSYILLSAVLVYLGIVAMMSMKNELVLILARGGSVAGPADGPEISPTLNCKILDTNVIIDGRIADVCRTGFLEGTLYVPGFVLEELQHIADSGDSLKRARGRRGLDILNNMQKELPLVVRTWDKALDKSAQSDEVDTRLVKLAKALEGIIVTNDFNLNKVAALQGVQVLNVNELANALKPVVLPGEAMTVAIVKDGKEPNQGVAYLDDGTMIVVEDGRRFMGSTLSVIVTSVLQTVAGKMIFARIRTDDDGEGVDYTGNGGESRDARGSNGHTEAPNSSGYTRRGTGKKIR